MTRARSGGGSYQIDSQLLTELTPLPVLTHQTRLSP